MKIRPTESVITGNWTVADGKVAADANCERIEQLTADYLVLLKTDPSGWANLYQDPLDSTYWERIYPKAEMHGGGPPELRKISIDAAVKKYGTWPTAEINK